MFGAFASCLLRPFVTSWLCYPDFFSLIPTGVDTQFRVDFTPRAIRFLTRFFLQFPSWIEAVFP